MRAPLETAVTVSTFLTASFNYFAKAPGSTHSTVEFWASGAAQEQRMEARDAWGYLIIWEFRPRTGKENKFEKIYGSHGMWAEFFRRGKGYCGTELTQDTNDPGRYLTFDFWTSRQACEQFRESNLAEYKRIDELCEEITQTELELGKFEKVVTSRSAKSDARS